MHIAQIETTTAEKIVSTCHNFFQLQTQACNLLLG